MPINNVLVVGWKCVDFECTQVSNMISGLSPSGKSSGNNNHYTVTFPDAERYLLLFFHNEYIYKFYRTYGSLTGDVYFRPSTSSGPFNKKPNSNSPSACKSNINSFTVTNKIGEWLPLTIDTTIAVDQETASAFSPQTNTYFPSDDIYKSYREIETQIRLRILSEQNAVYTDTTTKRIFSGTSVSSSFSIPSNTLSPGNYTVSLTTHVTDPKCSQVEDVTLTQNIEVFPTLPDEVCVIVADPVETIPSPITNQQQGELVIGSYYYYMDKQYRGEYENLAQSHPNWYDIYLIYTGISANYSLQIRNASNQQVMEARTGTFPKSFTSTIVNSPPAYRNNTLSWTPQKFGDVTIALTMTSQDPLCPASGNDFSRGIRTDTIFVSPRNIQTPYYCDNDKDNYYSSAPSAYCPTEDCNPPQGCRLFPGNDCDYSNPGISPSAMEICNDGLDNNCNSLVDCEDFSCKESNWWVSFMMQNGTIRSCGSVDCDDNDTTVYPGAPELCDGKDNNCNGRADEDGVCGECLEGESRQCGISDKGECSFGQQKCISGIWGECIGAVLPKEEICDGKDNNCNGQIDELENCCKPGERRECKTENCIGEQECINYAWGSCKTNCILEITSPKNNGLYTTCGEEKPIILGYTYTGQGECFYSLNSGAPKNSATVVRAPVGFNIFSLDCGGIKRTASFLVEKVECHTMEKKHDDSTGKLFIEEGYKQEDVDKARETAKLLEHSLEYSYGEDETIINSIIQPKQGMEGLTYNLFIPKCLTEYLSELEFDYGNYDIIKEDPVINWHFTDVNERIEITYRIKKRISPECLDQIKGLPIADLIEGQLSPLSPDKPRIFLFVGIIAFILFLLYYVQKHQPPGLTDQEINERSIERGRKKLLRQVKEAARTKGDAEEYMKKRGITQEDREWVLGRL